MVSAVAEPTERLPCIDLEREEHVRDEWLVLALCGNGHCDGCCQADRFRIPSHTTVVGRKRPTRMLRGDVL